MIDAIIDKYTTPERPLTKRNIENMIKIVIEKDLIQRKNLYEDMLKEIMENLKLFKSNHIE